MAPQADDSIAHDFRHVLEKELEAIRQARQLRREQQAGEGTIESKAPDTRTGGEGDPYQQAHAANLLGLSFSGGGIRSATFHLGLLQALAELRLLACFDYLSTVSGGGYIGTWLAGWIKHAKDIWKVIGELASQPQPGSSAGSSGSA